MEVTVVEITAVEMNGQTMLMQTCPECRGRGAVDLVNNGRKIWGAQCPERTRADTAINRLIRHVRERDDARLTSTPVVQLAAQQVRPPAQGRGKPSSAAHCVAFQGPLHSAGEHGANSRGRT